MDITMMVQIKATLADLRNPALFLYSGKGEVCHRSPSISLDIMPSSVLLSMWLESLPTHGPVVTSNLGVNCYLGSRILSQFKPGYIKS